MNRLLVYRPAAERALSRMDRSDAERIIRALEMFAAAGYGGRQGAEGCAERPVSPARRQVRIFFSFEQPDTVVVTEVDNRGQAY